MLIIKFKIMPVSAEVGISAIAQKCEETIKKLGGDVHDKEEQSIAFGLKALVFTITWPDNKSAEELEKELSSVQNVGSVEMIDVRRAIG